MYLWGASIGSRLGRKGLAYLQLVQKEHVDLSSRKDCCNISERAVSKVGTIGL